MCVCSGKSSDSKPRSSAQRASSPGATDSSVAKMARPSSMGGIVGFPAMAALDDLRERLAELSDLHALARLAGWDQRVMMPPGGGPARAHHLATLERLTHV